MGSESDGPRRRTAFYKSTGGGEGLNPENGKGRTDLAAGRRAAVCLDQRPQIREDGGGIHREHWNIDSHFRDGDSGAAGFRARQFRMLIGTVGVIPGRFRVMMTTVGRHMGRTAGMAEAIAVTLNVPEERSNGNQHKCANPSRVHPEI